MKYINSKFIKNLSIIDKQIIDIMLRNIKNGDSFCYCLSCGGCIFSERRNIYGVDCCDGNKSSLPRGKKDEMLFIKDLEELKSIVSFPNGYKRFGVGEINEGN